MFVAARDLRVNGREFKAGELFPYAELGLVHARAVHLWKAGRLKVAPPETVALRVTPGERVDVETPSQQAKKRRARS